MARVKTITVGIETSMKIKEYQYYKPRIDITYELADGEKPGDIMKAARSRLKVEIEKLEKEFSKDDTSDIPY